MPPILSQNFEAYQAYLQADLTPMRAIQCQNQMRQELIFEDRFDKVDLIAGADVALSPDQKNMIAAWVLFEFPSLAIIERVYDIAPLIFPYVPGLLSFREGPVLLKSYQKLSQTPDLIMFDGQGSAHPRRVGIASHMGFLLDIPSLGCGKSKLCGHFIHPKLERGNWTELVDRGETIGAVLRTKDKVNPVFISPGHRISLLTSIQIALQCHSGYRIPQPTREADAWLKKIKMQIF